MKKILSIFGLVAGATVLFTNCTQSLDVQSPVSNQFSLIAVTNDVKTSNDGLTTKWVAQDAINVFHALADSTTYGSNDSFTIEEEGLSTGKFTGTLTEALDPAQSYDWYALYPYSKHISTPKNASGYLNIGSANSSTAQVQSGNNSKAHLAGKYFPLYAKATGVAGDAKVTLPFKNALSVVKVKVTNGITKPVTVTNISMTAVQDIIGSYYIDFSDSLPKFTSSGDSYVSKTVKLNVEDAEAIPAGSSADFYFAIKPFENAATDSITITVNGISKSFASAVSFASGVIKTINFTLDQQPVTSVAFDLSKNTPYAACTDSLAWTNDYCDMVLRKGTSNNSCTNYYPGTSGKTYSSTRAYIGMTLTIAPKSAYQNSKIVIEATSETYANALKTSTWTNASASLSGKTTVIVTPVKYSDPVVASINATTGMTSVNVYYSDREIIRVTGISLDSTSVSIKKGNSVTISAIVTPADASDKSVTWSSNAESIATVKDGVITGVAPGSAIITATTVDGGYKATCSVTVLDGIEDIVLDMTTKTVGQTKYSETITYGDWIIQYGANNNKGWPYFKMGGKSATLSSSNPCSIWYTKEVTNPISKVTVHLPAGSLSKTGMDVNSWGVYVYSDDKMTKQVDYVAGGTISSGEVTFNFTPSTGKTWTNCYVKVSWNLANTTTTNGIICVDKITLVF